MESEKAVLRLAKPKRRGIPALIFSRLFIILLLMAAQVALYVAFFERLNTFMPHYAALQGLFALCMVLYLFNDEMDSSAKLTWLALIAVVPLFGAVMLAFTKANLGQRTEQKRAALLTEQSRGMLEQDAEVTARLRGDPYGTDDLCRYLNRSGVFPIFQGTQVSYFPSGEAMFDAMLQELERAEKFILMEYFIIEEGYMWGRILDVLSRKAKQGVEVRVMYDGMCEITKLPYNYPKLLAKLGIEAKTFYPVAPLLSSHYNYRDHRKIMVIDGKVAFNGGVNLADEYINRRKLFGHWKDTAVMLRGLAVSSFTLMFMQMWNMTEKQPEFWKELLESEPVDSGHGFVMPYGDCPLDEDKVG